MGMTAWADAMYNQRTEVQRADARCQRCGIRVSVNTNDSLGYCGTCWTQEREREAALTQSPEMAAIQSYEILCNLARAFSQANKKMEFWEDASHVGFQVYGPGARRAIYYVNKGDNDGPPTLTEWMNGLYEAMGQPDKVTKKPEPAAPKKSIYEWLRKPGV